MSWTTYNNGEGYINLDFLQRLVPYDNGDGTCVMLGVSGGVTVKLDTGSNYATVSEVTAAITAYLGSGLLSSL